MPRFEIWMPKSPKVPMDLRLRLEAESWIDALRTGLAKAGEGGPAAENVLCDIKEDNSIHVTDTASGRVFRIMEIEIDATAEQVVTQPPPAAEEPADDSATLPEMPAARDEVITQPSMPAVQAPAQVPPAQVPPKPEPAPARVSEPAPVQMPAAQAPAARVQPAQVQPAPARVSEPAPVQMPAAQAPAARVQPAQVPPEPAAAARVARLVPARVPPEPEPAWETSYQAPAGTLTIGRSLDFTSESTADLLEEVFEISDKISETRRFEDALYLILDLAMEKVSTDSGSVFLADINSDDLVFGAARGPKASQVKGFKLKMGQGIVGFCAAEGIGLAVSDVTRDPRFYSTISQKVGYNTRSILCVPMQADGRVMGALELINKRAGNVFTERDLGVASFLGQHLARYLASRERK